MKITFPHLGDAHLIGRIFFKEIGIDIITPSPNSTACLEIGSANSPDEICLPFKLMMANLMESWKMGADTVIMPATMGPCRLGEYGELLKSILDRKGFLYQWILLDSTKAIGKKELLRRLSLIIKDSGRNNAMILLALKKTYQILRELENLEQKAHKLCGYEKNKGECKQIVRNCRKDLENAETIRSALRIIKQYVNRLDQIEMDPTKKPLHLILTGEIYSCIEPFANHHIEELLMDMGVVFEKRVTLGWWVRNTILNPLSEKTIKNNYMPYAIGGYAKETIDDGLLCSRKAYDGVIQIFPVGCMPEIVAKSVFTRMSKETGIRVMSVIYDEMGGEAGYITRIEAFIDMLARQKGNV
jgi:Uncharacterized protein conserved in bacteria